MKKHKFYPIKLINNEIMSKKVHFTIYPKHKYLKTLCGLLVFEHDKYLSKTNPGMDFCKTCSQIKEKK